MNPNTNSLLTDISETAESVIAPPQIDIIGILMMSGIGIVAGLFVSIAVMIATFFSAGSFTTGANINAFFLSFFTFFAFCFGAFLYLSLAKSVFPKIYIHNSLSLKYVMMFFVILYIFVLPLYLMVETGEILMVYLIHTLLSILGIELIAGVISQYRYILLSLYANLISVVSSGSLVFLISKNFGAEGKNLFIIMGLAIFTFFLSTVITFFIKWLYYRFYLLSGQDPLGGIFYEIERAEQQKVLDAQNSLLQK